MKKKVLAVLLGSAMIAASFIGCGSSETATTTTDDATATETTDAGDTASAESLSFSTDVKLGVEVYDTTDEQFLQMKAYFDYLESSIDNLSFVYSESLADADAELNFIDSCASSGCNGIIGYYNIAEDAAIDECIAQGMYYWGTESCYDSFADNDMYVGCYTFPSEDGVNGDYLGGYYMALGLADAGVQHVFYCSGGLSMNIPMFVDRNAGFEAGIAEAQANGSTIQYDPSTDRVDGWPDADGFAQNIATILDGDYDGAAASFNAAALFQPIATAGKDSSMKVATIGEVSDTYTFAVESGEIAVVVYDCEEVVFGNAVVELANAICGSRLTNDDGTAFKVPVNRWVVSDADTYNTILDYHNGGNYYVTASDVVSLVGASAADVESFYYGFTADSVQ